ncbi:MAG: hypothetical protein U0992_06500 [Planctomycetaceae bacterium]
MWRPTLVKLGKAAVAAVFLSASTSANACLFPCLGLGPGVLPADVLCSRLCAGVFARSLRPQRLQPLWPEWLQQLLQPAGVLCALRRELYALRNRMLAASAPAVAPAATAA